ncbi:hypothetical protein SAMD00019534_074010 [Acytostelium subglobosum LB1]|uniref:hypothetical protein n=1 Tax=Acytostelium subglobosum LB1 TaxID=1410327 RepID=UPI000644AB19|nr:hypothetical protein SAMD00019534_074010 [Acytostelium subglobosum LB1]GAM24226.1 hypothetical protein SAMD00019534_074010 [Acytostelium subglobosum LB1]|eukprot:XP_012752552.1 hypothetical protein SAMD00019534_074010 [Acytostelium subglobosum LB1]
MINTLHSRGCELITDLVSIPSQLRRIPITEVTIHPESDATFVLADLPPTLNILSLNYLVPSQPPLDLTHLCSLTYLSLDGIQGPLDGAKLPESLTELYLDSFFNQPVYNLPASVTKLSLKCMVYPHKIEHRPLQKIDIHDLSSLSSNTDCPHLRELIIERVNQKDISRITSSSFPVLEKLKTMLGSTELEEFNLSTLPASLRMLDISHYGQMDPQSLPNGITDLRISYDEGDTPLPNIPPNVQTLTLHGYHDKLDVSKLPQSLTSLELFSHKQQVDLEVFQQLPSLRCLAWFGSNQSDNINHTLTIKSNKSNLSLIIKTLQESETDNNNNSNQWIHYL